MIQGYRNRSANIWLSVLKKGTVTTSFSGQPASSEIVVIPKLKPKAR